MLLLTDSADGIFLNSLLVNMQ